MLLPSYYLVPVIYNRLRWRDVNVGNPGDIQGCKSILFKIKSIAVQTAPRDKNSFECRGESQSKYLFYIEQNIYFFLI